MALTDSLTDVVKRQMAEKLGQMLAAARKNSLRVRIPENFFVDDKTYVRLNIAVKTWDVLGFLVEIAGVGQMIGASWVGAKITAEAIAYNEACMLAVAQAGGEMAFMNSMTFVQLVEFGAPIAAWAGMWIALGSPYFQIKQDISNDRAKKGVAHGILIGAFGRSPTWARGFLNRRHDGSNDNWVPGLNNVATKTYRMAFLAGYKVGKEMSQDQRKVFWKVFAYTLRFEKVDLWKNEWQGRSDGFWDNWFLAAGTAYMKWHVDTTASLPLRIANQ